MSFQHRRHAVIDEAMHDVFKTVPQNHFLLVHRLGLCGVLRGTPRRLCFLPALGGLLLEKLPSLLRVEALKVEIADKHRMSSEFVTLGRF